MLHTTTQEAPGSDVPLVNRSPGLISDDYYRDLPIMEDITRYHSGP